MRSLLLTLRRHWIKLAVVAGLLLGYTLGGFLLLPWAAQKIIHQQVEKLGRKVAIGKLTFNPYTFEINIATFALTEADGSPLIGFNHLLVNAEPADSIWQRSVVLKEIWLSKPDIALIVEADGSLNLAKLVPPSTEPEPAAPASLPAIRIGSFAVEFGRIGIEDRSRPQAFKSELSPIAFALHDFRTDAGHENAYTFGGTAATGEELEWSGNFSLQPLASSGSFALRKLQTSTVASYLQDQLPLQLVSGSADIAGTYQLVLSPTLSLDLALPAIIVQKLALAERGADKSSPPVSIAEIAVRDIAVSLSKREVAIGRVEIGDARIDARREADGSLNLSRLAGTAPAAAKQGPAPPPTTAAAQAETPWRVAVASVRLSGGAAKLEDRTVSPSVKLLLAPLTTTITGVSTDADAKLHIVSELGIDQGGRLHAEADLQLQPLSAQLALDLAGFSLPVVQPYLSQTTNLNLQSGLLAVKGKVDYRAPAADPAQLSFAGDVSVNNLRSQDQTRKQDFLKWNELAISGIAFSQAPDRLSIDRIALSQPFARVVIEPDRTINVSKLMKARPAASTVATKAAKPAAKSEAAAALPIRIKTISIEKGQLSFADQSITPSFAADIRELKGSISGLSTDAGARAKIRLDGKVDEYSPVLIEGEASPLAAKQYIDIAMSFRNMELTRFNPYSGRFAGYNITKGKLTTELKYRIDDRALDASHHVVLDQLEFGDKTGSKDAVPLPVKLAVALLKDRRGVIDLQLPVSGSLDDPAFKIAPIIWKTFTNLLTRIVAAPFAALGSLFGGGEELAYVDFAPGTAGISGVEAGKLEKLAAALVERPQLKLDVPLTLNESRDSAALAAAALEQRIAAYNTANYAGNTPKARFNALEQMYRETLGAKPTFPAEVEADESARLSRRTAYLQTALSGRITPNPAELEELSRQRASAVQSALLKHAEIAPERIFLTTRASSGSGEAGQVRMELRLE